MKKVTLLFLFLYALQIFPQIARPGQREFRAIIYSGMHFIPATPANKVYYTFRIPNNRLVFEKNNSLYYAEYSVAVEVFDSVGNFVVRNYSSGKIQAESFEQTDSEKECSEGVLEFSIPNGTYNIIPSFTDVKSAREIKLKPIKIITSQFAGSRILNPIITDTREIQCGSINTAALTNFEENIPFSQMGYNLVIPVSDSSINRLYVKIVNDKDTLFNESVTENYSGALNIEKCSTRIILNSTASGTATKNFVVKNFNRKLIPGNYMITVSSEPEGKPERTFQKSVIWYLKPRTLADPEFAIHLLKYTASDSDIKQLLDEDKDNYIPALYYYWQKFDPTPGTAFNELMAEYYERADYADLNFAPIAGKKGIDTDRGKIFIVFGKPQSIMRTSNEFGKVVETWVYEKPARKFIFVDQRGTGDFSLING